MQAQNTTTLDYRCAICGANTITAGYIYGTCNRCVKRLIQQALQKKAR